MKIFITGATGFIGHRLSQFLVNKEHFVTGLGRSLSHPLEENDKFDYISADGTQRGDWQDDLPEADAVINLAGVNIFRYWTSRTKKLIYDSRIQTTRNVIEAMSGSKVQVLVNASAIGYYGDTGDHAVNEDAAPGKGFLAEVCVDWEKEALKAEEKNNRVVLVRFGVVLGKNGGALPKMILPFKMFAGGPMGSGNQWFSWIHREDLLSAILFTLENNNATGAFNLCAPNPVRNREFAEVAGDMLNRPSFFRVPSFMIKLVMGEMGASMLQSQKALPERLANHGFQFKYPYLKGAMEAILKQP